MADENQTAWAVLIPRDVPVRDHRELIAWQLANELRGLIIQATADGPPARDFKFKSQLNDAISSVCRNLSEGFYMYGPSRVRPLRQERTWIPG